MKTNAHFLTSISIFLLLLLGGCAGESAPPVTYKSLPPDEQGLSDQERLDLARLTVAFIQYPAAAETAVHFLARQTLPGSDQPLYNARELAHLVDVKRLTDAIQRWGRRLALLLLVGPAIVLWHGDAQRRRQLWKAVQRGAEWGFFTLLAAGLLTTLLWPVAFLLFHEWFFPPGSWLFASSDTLIRLFPERLWMDYATQILVLLTEALLATSLGSALLARRAWWQVITERIANVDLPARGPAHPAAPDLLANLPADSGVIFLCPGYPCIVANLPPDAWGSGPSLN